ncbi:MAG: response regulator transcription factor [Chitinophagaceae bacterium]|nr:response regulator transcription factor [Chitinophagaceae bacterium]MCW5904543.1 response regulator transcription factor [Chitinophagaceae bacterium]
MEERLNSLPNIHVLFTAENGIDFLEQIAANKNTGFPDVVLMDIDMPNMNGIEAVAKGKERYPNVKFLMLTIFDEDDKIFQAIKAGASGYLLKDEPVSRIAEAIEDLMQEKGAPMSPSIARRTLHLLMTATVPIIVPENTEEEDYGLSEREKQVLEFLVDGLEYKEISLQLNVSPNTIRNHISKIYKKLYVTSKAQAIKVFNKKSN